MADEIQGVIRDGLRVLRDPYGNLVQVDPKGASALLKEGVDGERFSEVTEDEVRKRDFEIANGGVGGQLETYKRAAHEAAGDLVTLPGRLLSKPMAGYVNATSRFLGGPNAPQVDAGEINRAMALGAPAIVAGISKGGTKEEKLAEAERYAEETRQLKAVNPKAALAGNIGGNVGVGIMTGGATVAGGKMATTALMRAGMGRVAAGVVGTGAAMGVEGALFGAAGAETAARDAAAVDGATAEQLRHGMGVGFLLGAGLGAGSEVARAGLGGLRRKVGEVAERFRASQLTAPRPGAVDSRAADLWARTTGADRNMLDEIGAHNTTPEAQAKRAQIANFDRDIDRATVEMTQDIDHLERGLHDVRRYVDEFEPRSNDVKKLMQQSWTPQELPSALKAASKAGREEIRSALEQTRAILGEIEGAPMLAEAKSILTKHFTNQLHKMEMQAAKLRPQKVGDVFHPPAARSAAEINGVLNTMKKDMQKFERAIGDMKGNQMMAGSGLNEPLTHFWTEFERRVQEPMRGNLENMEIWGRAGEAQSVINSRYAKMIKSSQRYSEEFQKLDPNKAWEPRPAQRRYADSAKVGSWAKSLGTAEGTTRQAMARQHLADVEEFLGAVEQYHPLGEGAQQSYDAARAGAERIKGHLSRLDESVRLKQGLEGIREAERRVASIPGADVMGRAVGAVAGGALAGTPGAVIGATGVANRIPDIVRGYMAAGPVGARIGMSGMLTRPAAAIDAATALQGLANNVATRLESRAADLVRGAAQRVGAAAAATVRTTARAARAAVPAVEANAARDRRRESYLAKVSRLQEIRDNPETLVAAIDNRIPGLAAIAPGVAGELTNQLQSVADFLLANAPAGATAPTALEPARKTAISRTDLAAYERLWRAVEDPFSVLDDVAKGTATPDQIRALKLSPGSYELVRQAVLFAVADATQRGEHISLSRRRQLDMLLDLQGAGVPAFKPEIADMVSNIRQAKQKKPASQARAPRGRASNTTIPNAMKTAEQKWSGNA